MTPHVRAAALAAACALLLPAAALAVDLPPNFIAEDVTPSATWETPVGICFLPGGRMLVIEKRGHVYSVTNGIKNPTPMLNISAEVLDAGDRGLLGIAVDPNYLSNRYVYLLYTVDPDSNNSETNDDAFGRLARYTVSAADSNLLTPSSRTILMGVTWSQGPVSCSQSHTIGTLRFGEDGSLLVGAGDGASFNFMDDGGSDPNAFTAGRTSTYEDIGAFRAQSLTSLAGKILRINPTNGQGYSSNPFWDGNPNSIRSRVWAYGLRNPYRFCVEPGTGDPNPANGNPGLVHIGDVGWNRFEELNIVTTPGMNYGWPCIEGPNPRADYQAGTPPHNDCDSHGTADNPRFPTLPVSTWHHSDDNQSIPPEFIGNTAIGGVYYTGDLYPAEWRNRYFAGDYGQNWIKVFDLNGSHQLTGVRTFADIADGPVDFALEPVTKNILYVSINTGEIRRIRYTGIVGNSPPVAVATGTPDVGVAPLPVNFSSAGSIDPDGDPFSRAWDFGDGAGSSAANPSHTYVTPGAFNAVLTLDDGEGGIGRDTVRVIVAASSTFPSTAVLDNFNRGNGAIGGSWVDQTTGLAINANALAQTCCYATTVWNGAVFGPDQEAYIRFNATTATAPEHDLMLKVQGTSYAAGHIEVRYTATLGRVQVSTYTAATQWVPRGGPIPVTFAAGDQFGARAFSNGAIEVYKNGVLIGSTSAGNWPFAAQGGRLGMTLDGATNSRLDDFGGGDVVLNPNTRPDATILSPANLSFFVAGDTIHLDGTASDGQDLLAALQLHWQVDLHHNNHTHPGTFVGDGASQSFLAEDHDDGTGVFYRAKLIVTDTGALRDTASVDLFPEVDLEPSPVTTLPSTPGTTAPATYRFTIANHGRMPAPVTRWRLRAGNTLLAEGDTLVAALDSVTIVRALPPGLAAGDYSLRVTADTLGAAFETVETNNARTRTLTVVEGPGPDEIPPAFTGGPLGTPGGNYGDIEWATDEVTTGVVRYGQTLALGDSAASPDTATAHFVRLIGLPLGVQFYFQVVARDSVGNAVVSMVDSFTTLTGPLAVDDRPARFELSAPWPNPTAGRVRLSLALPSAAVVRFSIHDIQGRQVWVQSEREFAPGRHILEWDGRGAARPGVYLARTQVAGRAYLRRFAFIR